MIGRLRYFCFVHSLKLLNLDHSNTGKKWPLRLSYERLTPLSKFDKTDISLVDAALQAFSVVSEEDYPKTRKRSNNAGVASLERLKVIGTRGPKRDPRCYRCMCWRNKISQPNLRPPSCVQERWHKVRKSGSQVFLGSMRPTLYASCRPSLCGRCTRCSSD